MGRNERFRGSVDGWAGRREKGLGFCRSDGPGEEKGLESSVDEWTGRREKVREFCRWMGREKRERVREFCR